MKGIIVAVLVVLGMVGVSASGQTSRPRVAATPTPPTIKNDPGSSTRTGPPTLGGRTDSRTSTVDTSVKKKTSEDDSDEVVKVETNLVTMPVSVLDRDGRFIGGLRQQDFQIFENNLPQKVDYFASVETPFTVVMLLDVSPSTQWQIEDIQTAAITFVDKLRPSDRVIVISFDEKVHVLTRPTNDRNALRMAIRSTEMGDGTSLYEAVDVAINQQLKQIQGRKAVVLFTDGVDTTSRRASYQSTISDVEESEGLFYTIRYDTSTDNGGGGWGGGSYPPIGNGGTWGRVAGIVLGGGGYGGGGGGRRGGGGGWGRGGGRSSEYATGKAYLEALAQNSGGREFEAGTLQNLDAAFSGIAEELRRQYSIGYYPEKAGTIGERKSIRIRVARPDVVVRAKNSYIVGQTDRTIAGK
ncbi:MAG: VWA domain-containing protein [Acidobacteriota bacterium]